MLSNGESYDGEFRNDKIHGRGLFTRVDGSIVRGVWSEGVLKSEL